MAGVLVEPCVLWKVIILRINFAGITGCVYHIEDWFHDQVTDVMMDREQLCCIQDDDVFRGTDMQVHIPSHTPIHLLVLVLTVLIRILNIV